LRETLALGPVDSKLLFQQARSCGIINKTLRRAALDLGLRPVKRSFAGPWKWQLDVRSASEASPSGAQDGQGACEDSQDGQGRNLATLGNE
jgi:hypothetical protein